jgi:hypothetical protein
MFTTLYLPNFYLQAAMRHQPELRSKPVALIETQQRKVTITELNEPAERAGVCLGMTPSQGLARCLRLIIKIRALAQEKAIAEILLQHAFTLSPYVEATGPGVCTIQFTDNRNLEAKVSRVIENLGGCEILGQGGIASNPDTSFLAAHLARPVLRVEKAKEFLAPLPVELVCQL